MVDLALLDNVEILHGLSEYFLPSRLFQVRVEKDAEDGFHLWTPRAMNLTRSTKMCRDHERYTGDPGRNLLHQPERGARWIQILANPSHAIVHDASVPADCIEKVVHTKTEVICKTLQLHDCLQKSYSKEAHSVVPALGKQSRMRRSSRSNSKFKDSHTMQYSKMKIEQG